MSKSDMLTAFVTRAEALAPLHGHVARLLAPLPLLQVAALDIFGAARLSMGAFWTGNAAPGTASVLQEVIAILVVVFGGETFLAACTGTPPSWLLNPTLACLFAGTHGEATRPHMLTADIILTRTRLRSLLPRQPDYAFELLMTIPDAIGRTLLLTQFSVVPLLRQVPGTIFSKLPPTPSTLLLVPFILAVPFASAAFSGLNLFGEIRIQTPAELRPWGWTASDAWLPIVIPTLFLSLIGPVKGWPWGLGTYLSESAAMVVCAAVVSIVFFARTVINLRPRSVNSQRGKKVKRA